MASRWSRGIRSAALLLLLALIAWAHVWRLDEVPRGLYVDESSIGLNAATIAESGRDEHGVAWPVFFKAFGEWKNPVHVYAAALVFKVSGVSVAALRATSFLFFLALLGGVWALARALFPDSRATALWAVAATGFLPWFFTVSRLAFEAIAQPAVVVWALWLLHRAYEAYEREGVRGRAGFPPVAILAGLAAGLSIYTYSTARLLSPLLLASLLIAYSARRYWTRHLLVGGGFLVACVPYAVFTLRHPGALTGRFRGLSFLFDEAIPLGKKAWLLAQGYGAQWSGDFLLVTGDPNQRHATGHAGQVFVVVLALAVAGLIWAVRGSAGRSRFTGLLFLNLLAAPLPAALTGEPHALRGLLLGLYLVIFSCYGFHALTRIADPERRRTAVWAASFVLALEAAANVWGYFGPYPQRSIGWFESYDFPGALRRAVKVGARRIVVSPRGNQPYAHLEFYRRTLDLPPSIPVAVAEPAAAPGTCVLYSDRNEVIPNPQGLPSRVWWRLRPTRLRCFTARI